MGVRVLPLPQVIASALPIARVHVAGDRRGLGIRQGGHLVRTVLYLTYVREHEAVYWMSL